MDDAEQADAYARADFADVNQSFIDRFVATFPAAAKGQVVDLGCGPADILVRLVQACPEVHGVGVDGAEAMLERGRTAIEAAGVSDRVRLIRGTLPGVDIGDASFDAVISNSLLHHLADPSVLWKEVLRLGRPGAPVMIMDLFRPATRGDAERIVEAYAKDEHAILKIDFYNSLLAAFTPGEVRQQLEDAGLSDLKVSEVSDRHLLIQGNLRKAEV